MGCEQKMMTEKAPVYLRKGSVERIDLFLYEIKEPEAYSSWHEILSSPISSNTEIVIHVNSPGGYVSSMLQLISLLMSKQEEGASIVLSIEGDCCSASTLLLIIADSIRVFPFSVFMFHDISSGYYGKTNGEMVQYITFTQEWGNNLFDFFYKEFLTDNEIKEIQKGKDIWLSAEQMIPRIEKCLEKRRKQQELLQKKFNSVVSSIEKNFQEETNNSKKTNKKKAKQTTKKKKEKEANDSKN